MSWGHSWVVLCVAVRLPFTPDRWVSLPVLFRLYLNKKSAAKANCAYRSRPALAVELVTLLCAAEANAPVSPGGRQRLRGRKRARAPAAQLRHDQPARAWTHGSMRWLRRAARAREAAARACAARACPRPRRCFPGEADASGSTCTGDAPKGCAWSRRSGASLRSQDDCFALSRCSR